MSLASTASTRDLAAAFTFLTDSMRLLRSLHPLVNLQWRDDWLGLDCRAGAAEPQLPICMTNAHSVGGRADDNPRRFTRCAECADALASCSSRRPKPMMAGSAMRRSSRHRRACVRRTPMGRRGAESRRGAMSASGQSISLPRVQGWYHMASHRAFVQTAGGSLHGRPAN